MVTSLPATYSHHTGPWQPERNETVTISKRLYTRLLAADHACQRTLQWVSYHPMRSVADAHADDDRRDAAGLALSDWSRLAGVEGGPR